MDTRIKEEIKGILAIVAGLIILISLISHSPWDQSLFTTSKELNNLLGSFGAQLSEILLQFIGYASYIIPVVLLIAGIKMVVGQSVHHKYIVFFGALVLLIIASSSIIQLLFGEHAGGLIGIKCSALTLAIVSTTGSYLIFATLTLISLMYLIHFSVVIFMGNVRTKVSLGSKAISAAKAKRKERKQRKIEDMTIPATIYEQEELLLAEPEIKIKRDVKSATRPAKKKKASDGEYELPGIELLNDPPPSMTRPSKEELIERSDLLEKKLLDYAVQGKVTYVSPGPIVTMFEFEPAPGIKISKVMSLAADLSMALKASSIRISPIHGRSTLGIEVPNREVESVFLRNIIANDAFQQSNAKLTLALGKDIFGVPVMTDLAKMPHLLIAGATGSGKSVGLNTIVLSLLYRATPKEVKMLMIDPKMLELSIYEDIPHLLMPVITLPKEASNALKTLVMEMERRYRLLADSGARNIESFNKKIRAKSSSKSAADTDNEQEPLPYIVIFIDELADLMFASGREVEDSIARLAGMARAAGIHLVLATQRPSVDVITGIIKANFPSRISFQVSSKMDSRIILDTYGAEQLLGKGDMLFTSPGKRIKRIHGAYVSSEETRNIVSHIKEQAGPDYTLLENLVTEPQQPSNFEEQDELYSKARDVVLSAGQASISYIQRRMKIGYNRAARIMEMLEEEGIVGPPRGRRKTKRSDQEKMMFKFQISNFKFQIHITIFLFILFLTSHLLPFTFVFAAETADDAVNRIQKEFELIKDISGRFAQKSYIKDLEQTMEFKGTFFLKKPEKIMWEYEGSRDEKVVMKNKETFIYKKSQNQVIRTKFSEESYSQVPIAMLESFDNIRNDFNITMPEKNALKLIPKQKIGHVKTVIMETSKKGFPIKMFTILDTYGNIIMIELKDIKTNQGVKDELFEFQIPEGAEVFDMSQ